MSYKFRTFPFGKYKGVLLQELPLTYVVYALYEFDLPEDLVDDLEFVLVTGLKMKYVSVDFLVDHFKSIGKEDLLQDII